MKNLRAVILALYVLALSIFVNVYTYIGINHQPKYIVLPDVNELQSAMAGEKLILYQYKDTLEVGFYHSFYKRRKGEKVVILTDSLSNHY